jgi:UDP-hydrolysing UDP-N-acetyl-D-glucosamine 2-epimerase
MLKRKICVVTGTRADYGLLYPLMKRIRDDQEFDLRVVATGMHLSPEFGLTYREIEKDGFSIDSKVEMLLSSDTRLGIAKSMGLGVIGFADVFDQMRPDLVFLLGDRFEILAAAQALLIARIPIAHIAGGDSTEGAFDEAIRHSVTKMSHLHFVTNHLAEVRVKQLGEDPDFVFNVGSPGIDCIKRMKFLTRKALEDDLGFTFLSRNLLVTFHPETLSRETPSNQLNELLQAIDRLGRKVGVIMTKPNADPDGRALIRLIVDFVKKRPHMKAFTSLGQTKYLSVMKQVDAVVGNSSSGLYEAPSFHVPTVNIGDRQKGRLKASSVIDCPANSEAIFRATQKAFQMDCSKVVNPYGDGTASEQIMVVLKKINDYKSLVKKKFFDLEMT